MIAIDSPSTPGQIIPTATARNEGLMPADLYSKVSNLPPRAFNFIEYTANGDITAAQLTDSPNLWVRVNVTSASVTLRLPLPSSLPYAAQVSFSTVPPTASSNTFSVGCVSPSGRLVSYNDELLTFPFEVGSSVTRPLFVIACNPALSGTDWYIFFDYAPAP